MRAAASFAVLVILVASCSADPRREHVWSTYERELVRLEGAGQLEQRLELARRGLLDPQASSEDRCRLRLEAGRTLQALSRPAEALAEVRAAAAEQASRACAERVDLLLLRLDGTPVTSRTFLVNHPRSPVYAAVLDDLLHGLGPAEAVAQLNDLLARTDDAAARCVLRLQLARRLQTTEPARALGLFDEVATAGCARSADAAVEAVGLLADQGRSADVRARFESTDDEAVAWRACRALERGADGADLSGDCLTTFATRFPSSRKVDDAWFLAAEKAAASGDSASATTLYRRIVDERPDAGRAAQARRRLEELRSPARP